jgi:uncharacterized repeat protein (TIGR01451 family)
MKRTWLAIISVLLPTLIVILLFPLLALPHREAQAATDGIRLSQAYGGGGNSGAWYKNDLIELYNAGSTSVTVDGWSVQYASSTGSTWSKTDLSGTIAPGAYYLIQEAQGSGGTQALPTPDITGTINLNATAGKVALVKNTTSLSGTCPVSDTIDFVGYGTTANCFEGSGPTPAPSNTASIIRKNGGCFDADVNATDFILMTPPTPRNSTSPANLCEANLSVTKSGPASAPPGTTLTYTIGLSNTGILTASSSRVTDTLPAEMTFITYNTALTVSFSQPDAHTLVWNLGDVAAGANGLQITVQGTISPSIAYGTLLTNTIAASTTAFETNTANNTAQATTFIGAPDVAVVKTGPASVNAGDTLTFTLAYSNAGNLDATGVVLVDQLPAAMSYLSDSLGTGVQVGGIITWTLSTLSANASGSIEITARALTPGTWPNVATISGGPTEANLLNNVSTVTTTIFGADPFVIKSDATPVFGGEHLTYTIVYGNRGNLAAAVTLTDTLPISFTAAEIVTDTSGLTPIAGAGTRSWTATLAAGDRFTYTLALIVPTTIANNTLITNTIEIATAASGNNPLDDRSSVSSTVYQIVPISEARAGSIGQLFAIEGKVTVAPGMYQAAEWAVQDDSGGISVFYSPPISLALGDQVRLVATRGNFSGQEQLSTPVYFTRKMGNGPEVTPRSFTTGQIAAGGTKGWLAVITGTVSSLAGCSTTTNYQFLLDDGSGAATIFVDRDTGVNVCATGIVDGDSIRVIGFSTEFAQLAPPTNTYEVKPRRPTDVAEYPRVLSVTPADNVTAVPITATVKAAFNLTMTNASTTTFSVQGVDGVIGGTVQFDTATQTATFTPTANLAYNTRYTATLKSTLAADNGLTLMPPQDYVWSFVTLQLAPQLTITKIAATAHSPVDLGEVVTYTLTLSNSGNDTATGIMITDVLPAAVIFGSFVQQNGATYNNGIVSWGGSLNADASAKIAFTATVASNQTLYGTDVTNTVQFTSGNGGSGSANMAVAIVKHYFAYLPLIKR